MGAQVQFSHFLDAKSDDDRIEIAGRVGDRLCREGLPEAERLAAEALARALVADAIERVRRALSEAVRHARFLPRDIALKIAHDVDSVACPFLEATEVFSEGDWQQLVLTISRGARIAVARRTSMSEGLARALAEGHDTVVAETLIGNAATPLSSPVCHLLIERFTDSPWVIEKMADRDDLAADVAAVLCLRVSAAARDKLAQAYNLVDFTEPVVAEAEADAVLQLVREAREAPETRLLALAEQLKHDRKLTPLLLITTLREGHLAFFSAAFSVLSEMPLAKVNSLMLHEGAAPVTRALSLARIPSAMHDDFWEALQEARQRAKAAGAASAAG
ncbi:MAG: DUF2336 domain-containing protein [Rhodospirillales bacterium]